MKLPWFERSTPPRGELRPDARIGHYVLVSEVSRGGMGEIWLARDEALQRTVAIKLIRRDRPTDDAARERFRLEARATAKLSSPHAVSVFDFGVSDDGTFYYVMEQLQGIDLHDMVTRFGPVPPARTTHVLVQACDALSDAHRLGLVHRDVSPSNVMLTRRGMTHDFVKVLDFGLVRAIGCDREELSTPHGVVGTPAFLPPEVAMAECIGECDVDGRADLYSLGAVAYWMLSGRTVFLKETAMGMAVAHAKEPPVRLRDVAPGSIPPELEDVVMSCLAKRPEDRPQSARDLASILSGIGRGQWTEREASEWWQEHLADYD